MRSLLLLAFATSSACAAPPGPPAAPPPAAPVTQAPPSVPAPAMPQTVAEATGELPLLVRKLLDGRMLRHGTDLGALETAVKAGDLPAVAVHARNIADEPRIARPLPGSADDTVNQSIPLAFFDFQDLLHQRAEALTKAAEARDQARVRAAYDDLGQTCGQCHQVWFPMPSD